jgi:hypothetical protein
MNEVYLKGNPITVIAGLNDLIFYNFNYEKGLSAGYSAHCFFCFL